MRRAIALLPLLVAGGLAAPAHAVTNAEILAQLNTERAANGLPADVVENAAWSQGCAAHDHYMALNDVLTHDEVPGAPGYTPAGATAGQTSVLAQGATWAAGDPWDDAPYHLIQVLDPQLRTTGMAEAEGYTCLVTLADTGRPPPVADTLYSFPGNGGAAPWFQVVRNELPRAPQEDLVPPIPQGTPTGPNVMVWGEGPSGAGPPGDPMTLASAGMTGPGGQLVDVGVVPNFDSGGFVIPRAPLAPATHYTVTAMFQPPGDPAPAPFSRTFAFDTTPFVDAQQLGSVSVARSGSQVTFTEHAREPLHARPATVRFTSTYGFAQTTAHAFREGTTWTVTAPPAGGGSVTLRATVPAFTFAGRAYHAATFTQSFTVAAPPRQPPSKPSRAARMRAALRGQVGVAVAALKAAGLSKLVAGEKLRLRAPAKGTLTLALRRGRGRATLGRGRHVYGKAGRARVGLKLTKAGRAALGDASTARLKLVARFAPARGAAVTTSRKLTVRR